MAEQSLQMSQENHFRLGQVPAFDQIDTLVLPELHIEDRQIIVTLGNISLSLTEYGDTGHLSLLENGHWLGVEQSLAAVPAHKDAGAGLKRFAFLGAPLHSALHVVSNAAATNSDYCRVHKHNDAAELNVIVPSSAGMVYRVFMGDKWTTVDSTEVLWFPEGSAHCAIATEGSGLFFVGRFPST